MNFGVGIQLQGQQGYTNGLTGKFELAENKKNTEADGAVDDTETLSGRGHDTYIPGAPRGPRHHRVKRSWREETCGEARMADQTSENGMDGGLNYG